MKLSQGPECILNASLGYPNSNPERYLWGKQHGRKRGWFWEERKRPHRTAPPQGLRPSTKFSSIGTTAPINHPSLGVGWHQGRRPCGRQEAWLRAQRGLSHSAASSLWASPLSSWLSIYLVPGCALPCFTWMTKPHDDPAGQSLPSRPFDHRGYRRSGWREEPSVNRGSLTPQPYPTPPHLRAKGGLHRGWSEEQAVGT